MIVAAGWAAGWQLGGQLGLPHGCSVLRGSISDLLLSESTILLLVADGTSCGAGGQGQGLRDCAKTSFSFSASCRIHGAKHPTHTGSHSGSLAHTDSHRHTVKDRMSERQKDREAELHGGVSHQGLHGLCALTGCVAIRYKGIACSSPTLARVTALTSTASMHHSRCI